MTKEEHNKIIDFVNSDDYMLLNSYISKPYEETIIEQDKEIERLNYIIKNLDKMFEYYFLGNLKYDQDTVNAIYIKYVKLKGFKNE